MFAYFDFVYLVFVHIVFVPFLSSSTSSGCQLHNQKQRKTGLCSVVSFTVPIGNLYNKLGGVIIMGNFFHYFFAFFYLFVTQIPERKTLTFFYILSKTNPLSSKFSSLILCLGAFMDKTVFRAF